MVLIINYALKNVFKDYTPFYKAIQQCGEWWHFLDSTWIVNTSYSADTVGKHLLQFIDQEKDFVIVARLQKDYQGWLPNEAWDWLNKKQQY